MNLILTVWLCNIDTREFSMRRVENLDIIIEMAITGIDFKYDFIFQIYW